MSSSAKISLSDVRLLRLFMLRENLSDNLSPAQALTPLCSKLKTSKRSDLFPDDYTDWVWPTSSSANPTSHTSVKQQQLGAFLTKKEVFEKLCEGSDFFTLRYLGWWNEPTWNEPIPFPFFD